MFESYAQNNEDVVLHRVLGHVEDGTYVDVGAADPDDDSVTKAFYLRGWTGIDVEPAHEHASRLREARPRDLVVEACAGESAGTMTLHLVPGTGLSSVVDESAASLADTEYEVRDVEVPVRRLDEILESAGYSGREIHFLKIDVEGFEESVIRGIDLTRWRPWVIVAEATAPRSPELVHHNWEPLLLAAGYQFCLFDGLNRFYVADEHAELAPMLSFPAGVFDQPFTTPPHAKLLREYDNLLEGNRHLAELHTKALSAYDEVNAELERSVAAYAEVERLYRQAIDDNAGLQAEVARHVEGYQRLHDEYENSLAGYERLHSEYDRTLAAHDRLLAQVNEQGVALAGLSAERDTLRAGVAEMAAEYDGLRAQRDTAQTELVLIRQTLSWKVTKPLRAVRRLRAR